MISEFTAWRKSTRSADGSACVEVSPNGDCTQVGVRDSKYPTAGPLVFESADWGVFITEAKAGAFNR